MEAFTWQEMASTVEAAAKHTQTTPQAMLSLDGRTVDKQAILVKAGGVDLLDLMKTGLLTPQRLLDISRLSELQGIRRESDGRLRIGALTTLAQLAAHAEIRMAYPALAQAAAMAASPQIRNRATIGGNLLQRPRCWYLRSTSHHCLRKGGAHCFALDGDNRYHAVFANQSCAIVHPSTPAVPLQAYHAQVELMNREGQQRVLDLDKFFLLPQTDLHAENCLHQGEILTGILLPSQASQCSVYLEQGERAAFDWPLAAVAVVLDLDEAAQCRTASIVLGAVAPVPWRARQAEMQLEGSVIDEALAISAGQAALDGATPLAHNGFKLPLMSVLLRRAILSLIEIKKG